MSNNLILASSSHYRKELLSKLGLKFSSTSPDIDEAPLPDEPPQILVKRLAEMKAQVVSANHPYALIIGSDQAAVHNGRIIGKPKDHKDAVLQLRNSSESIVTLYAGLALLNSKTGYMQSIVETFEVEFRELTDKQIENYLHLEKPYDCCGSLKAEGIGISLLKRLTGDDPNTLIGLPLIQLVTMLKNEGVEPIS